MYEVGAKIYFRDENFYARFGTIIESEYYHTDPDLYMLSIQDEGYRIHHGIIRVSPQNKEEEKRLNDLFERWHHY